MVGTLAKAYKQKRNRICDSLCDPGGARTLDPLIKSQLLYQLSYGVRRALNTAQK